MGSVKEINCIYIPTTNTEKTAHWYINNLGLELTAPITENQAQLRIPSGTSIFLIKTSRPTTLNYLEISGTVQSALTLEVNDFHILYLRMKDNGANVSDIEDNGSCGLNFYAYDPDGNKLDIWSGWPSQ
ncbi:VOC family protein [Sporosarcina thermotolerans]|uniref:VOC family protein n=1 Tax=Sporosarcina thermotolerans TaxID=633404 RepID=A0AAW9AB69_9BACL|nr:VOC family protein [Sporosarcina thermotolerans]MDW0118284.1 VOC family protein [Sporosarcina thermotolerans]WHT48595.1 VOC family protein [Sporosarcina thermotolerans]